MKKKLNCEDYKKAFDEFLDKHSLRAVYYKNLRHDNSEFFKKTPNIHFLVMAFNWAKITCPFFSYTKKQPITVQNEMNWKQIDLKWREVIKQLQGTSE